MLGFLHRWNSTLGRKGVHGRLASFKPVDHLAAQVFVQIAVAVSGAASQLQHDQFVGFVVIR
jgi:hypothetical protein